MIRNQEMFRSAPRLASLRSSILEHWSPPLHSGMELGYFLLPLESEMTAYPLETAGEENLFLVGAEIGLMPALEVGRMEGTVY